MSNLLQDFFRPDLGASNRALKKYLDDEGLPLGFRDLVCLRGAAEAGVFFSFALLEAWSAGEFEASEVAAVVERRHDPAAACLSRAWSYRRTPDDLLLVGVEGELAEEPAAQGAEHPDLGDGAPSALVPLQAVYGGSSLLSAPGAGGAWKEEELQSASLTLLDGESEEKLVEAFRHLFRAAPHGAARAAVVATALARHRPELNREVADKLEEISPPLGQALRQLFTQPDSEGKQALHFLLGSEASPQPPVWTGFWSGIRTTVLESLARSDKGAQVLRESLRALRATAEALHGNVLTHRLLDAFLTRHDLLTPEDRSHLLVLLERFGVAEPAAVETLASRLELSGDTQERILLGEALRRIYKQSGREADLERLSQRFAVEALSVGSTAGSLALAELLGSFGPSLLESSALTRLDCLSDRQTLNAMAMWEQLVGEQLANIERVSELFVHAMEQAEQHWGLLLKSSLLQKPQVLRAFAQWCAQATAEQRRRAVLVGQNWTLTVENRPLIAAVLGELEWHGAELWEQEWKRTTLSFQRLGWLAECLQKRPPRIDEAVEARILELLSTPRRNLYFWDLMKRVAGFPGLSATARERIVALTRELYRQLEAGLGDEKEALLGAATAALTRCADPAAVVARWTEVLRSGSPEELAWTFHLIRAVFRAPASPFQPERRFVSNLLQRLFQSGPDSMQQALRAALDKDDQSLLLPSILSLEVQNLGLEALAAVAAHPGCPPGIRGAVERRLALFLQQWGDDLERTDDVYSFRSTPLFALLEHLLEPRRDELQKLLDEVARTFLRLQRRHPERLRLEVRQSAQSFFARWVEQREEAGLPEVAAWRRVLQEVGLRAGERAC
jgi:hypothetical protein